MTFLTNSSKIKARLSQALNLFGLLLMLISLYFIATKLFAYKTDLSGLIKKDSTLIAPITLFIIAHVLALNILGVAWFKYLIALKARAKLIPVLSLYGITQIGKYLPGNIFHLAGRQFLAKKLKLIQHSVLLATACEIAGHLFASSVLIFILFIIFYSNFQLLLEPLIAKHFRYFNNVLLILAPVVVFGSLFLFKNKLSEFIRPLLHWNILSYFIFHCIAGVVFVFTVDLFYPVQLSQSPVIFCIYLISWLVGYIVPGSPGGLGVREYILVLVLATHIPESVILASALANRVVTTLGDVGFFIQAWLIKPRVTSE